jgi:hypothetical protein
MKQTKSIFGFEIEKGIPAPGRRGIIKPVIKSMAIGDSVFIPCGPSARSRENKLSNWRSTAWAMQIKLASKPEKDGVRVWRVE